MEGTLAAGEGVLVEIPVNFPVSREFYHRDGFATDWVVSHAVPYFRDFAQSGRKAHVLWAFAGPEI